MRFQFVLVVTAAACSSVRPIAADAGTVGTDASGCPVHIADPAPPSWLVRDPFVPATDPDNGHTPVWVSNGRVPGAAAFAVPFAVGDRITGLSFTGYGTGDDSAGLAQMEVIYQPEGMPNQSLSRSADLGRGTMWGAVVLPGFKPTVLSGGVVWVQFNVTEARSRSWLCA